MAIGSTLWSSLLTNGPARVAPGSVWKLIGTIALAQTLVLGYMVRDRVNLLTHGREITLDVVPVDPRSLFRGDYVRLGYDINRLDAKLMPEAERKGTDPRRSGTLYVTLKRGADGKWQPNAVRHELVAAHPEDEVVLKARYPHAWALSGTAPIGVSYGIERFYVPETRGLELEKDAREKRISVVVAVDKAGNAAIKRLLVDGQPVAIEQPL